MFRILFVNEKWTANIKEYGDSSSEHILYSAFQSTGLGEYRTFHFDEYLYEHGKKGDLRLIYEVLDYKPDIIFYSWLVGIHNPDIETFKIIKKIGGTKIVCMWWDFLWKPSIEKAEELSPFVDMHIDGDSPFVSMQIPMHSKRKHIPLWTPNDPNLYIGDPYSNKDLDIFFSGNIYRNYDYRSQYIDKLKDLNYKIYIGGEDKKDRLSIQEYTSNLKNVKIIPNFTQGTLKGRVFEATMCGALLLEPKKSVCGAYFVPNEDYVTYDDSDDFIDKVNYYLNNEKERLEIAARGHKRVIDNYNVERFWKIIFHKLGLIKYIDENKLYNKNNQMPFDEILEKSYNPY